MKYKIKGLCGILGVILIATIGLSGCGSNKGTESNGIITLAADSGGTNQFIRDWTGAAGQGSAPGANLFYEKLWSFDAKSNFVPGLAEKEPDFSWTPFSKAQLKQFDKDLAVATKEHEKDGSFSNAKEKSDWVAQEKAKIAKGGETVTIHLRKDVKWSDGEPFTSADVKFNYDNNYLVWQSFVSHNVWGSYIEPLKIIDDTTVQVIFNGVDFNQSFGDTIKPMHIFKNAPTAMVHPCNAPQAPECKKTIKAYDLGKYVDKNPVGTGPGKLISFNQGKVKIGWRDDYWGGKPDSVKEIDFVPQGAAAKIQADITNGTVDWAEGSANNIEKIWVPKSDQNHYHYFSNGGSWDIVFGFNQKPTDDPNVRKALRDSADPSKGAEAAGIGYPVPSLVGLDPKVVGDYILPEYDKSIEPNVDQAKSESGQSGYSGNKSGDLEKDGKAYPLKIWTSTTANPIDQIVIPIIVKQWQDALGIKVKWNPTGDTPYSAGKGANKYQLFTSNDIGGPGGGQAAVLYSLYSWVNYKPNYCNFGRWYVPAKANEVLEETRNYSPLNNKEKVASLNQEFEKYIVDDVPFVPYQGTGVGIMWSTKHWTNWPTEESAFYPLINSFGGGSLIPTLMHLKPAN